MEKTIQYIADLIWDIPMIITIMATGTYLTMASRLVQLQFLPGLCRDIWRFFFRSATDTDDRVLLPNEAFFISLGATVGIGNVIGVAMAVMIGGVGAIFWMWVSALVGMIIKAAEVTLATYYRHEESEGSFCGSPMDYMEQGIGKAMNFSTWLIPVGIFAAGIMATFFITLQSYEVSRTVHRVTQVDPLIVAGVYAALIYLCIYKGIKGYRRIACRLIPLVLLLYVGAGVLVLVSNYGMLVPCFSAIFREAFNVNAAFGGFAGRGMVEMVGQGMSIALFTNEAGWGTAPMLYSQAKTDHPVKLGLLGALEVFVVSMVICTTTALVVGVSGQYMPGIAVNDLVIYSFATGLGSLAVVFVPVILFILGITTSVGWYLYYEVIIRYFCRKLQKNAEPCLKIFKLVYPLQNIFMVFYALHFHVAADTLWNIMAITTGIPTFINVFSLLILSNKFLDLVQDYKNRQRIPAGNEEDLLPVFAGQEEEFYQ